MYYLDVHTHLTHERFHGDLPQVIQRAKDAGLGAIIVNGLEPATNRAVIKMAGDYPDIIKTALGIYPVEAVNAELPQDFKLDVERFDVWEEIAFIADQARKGNLVAIGECGLDGYWVSESTFATQEKVFSALIDIAMRHDLPLIVHSRKLEQRAGEILASKQAQKVIFHCFGGKVALAKELATKFNWYFSIPTNAVVNEAFRAMLKLLPEDLILTETDAPYLSPIKGTRNEPSFVVKTVQLWAEIKGIPIEDAKAKIFHNFKKLFN